MPPGGYLCLPPEAPSLLPWIVQLRVRIAYFLAGNEEFESLSQGGLYWVSPTFFKSYARYPYVA